MYRLTPKGRHSLLQEAPMVLLEAEAVGLIVRCEETQLGLSYLYQPAAPSPNLGESNRALPAPLQMGRGCLSLLQAPEC